MSTIVRRDRSTDRDETIEVHVMQKYDNKNGRISERGFAQRSLNKAV